MNESPNDQLYVFFGYNKADLQNAMDTEQRTIFKYLTANGLDGSRITFHTVKKGVDLVQFWRVPPGAANPTCDECEKSVCPAINIIGPAGMTVPGQILIFTIDANLKDLEKFNYKWTVSDGTIIEGQGKPWIHIQTTREIRNETITAKVTVEGRPEGCANSAESTAAISLNFHPHPSDEFGKLKPAHERARLDAFLSSLIKEPDFNGYIVTLFPKSTGPSVIRKRIKRMKDHIFFVRKIPRNRIVIVIGSSEKDSTVLWLLPPKLGESICSECKVQ
ncbi:MAG: hypothetical protein WKF92_14195 [Pyrinomonadaceae bacterium]